MHPHPGVFVPRTDNEPRGRMLLLDLNLKASFSNERVGMDSIDSLCSRAGGDHQAARPLHPPGDGPGRRRQTAGVGTNLRLVRAALLPRAARRSGEGPELEAV